VWFNATQGSALLGVFLRTHPTIGDVAAVEPSAPAA